jgi:hypothetical protein
MVQIVDPVSGSLIDDITIRDLVDFDVAHSGGSPSGILDL